MASVPEGNEVSLGGTYFPIKGSVRLTNVTVTQNPIVFGDTSHLTDTQVMSEFIQSHAMGGSGKYRGDVRTDFDRYWDATAETRFPFITMPPLVESLGRPPATAGKYVTAMCEFNGRFFVAYQDEIYYWVPSASGTPYTSGNWGYWATLAGTVTDMAVYRNKLFLAVNTTSQIVVADSTFTIISTDSYEVYAFALYDDKLWRFGYEAPYWKAWTTPDGVTYDHVATLKSDYPSWIRPFLYRDAAGAQRVYVQSPERIYIVDQTDEKMYRTEMVFPRGNSTGITPVVHVDGKLYVPYGNSSLAAVEIGNPTIITPVGIERDDGVPVAQTGVMLGLLSTQHGILSLYGNYNAGTYQIRSSSGGWGMITSGTWQAPMHAFGTFLDTVYDPYNWHTNIYWADNLGVYMIREPNTMSNPRRGGTGWKFSPNPAYLYTPWWSFGSDIQPKLVSHVSVQTYATTANEYVEVYYATDLNDGAFTLLGVITAPGLTTFKLASGAGTSAKWWRLAFVLGRGSDSTKAPIIDFYAIEHMRLLPATYGYVFEVDLSSDHKGNSPERMLAALKTLADAKQTLTLIPFSYKDPQAQTPRTHLVRISRFQGQEWTGPELRGQGNFLVSVIAPYGEDST